MKNALKYLWVSLIIMFFTTYLIALFDHAFLKTGIWHKDMIASVFHYLFGILPHWWWTIMMGTLILFILFYAVRVGINKLEKNGMF